MTEKDEAFNQAIQRIKDGLDWLHDLCEGEYLRWLDKKWELSLGEIKFLKAHPLADLERLRTPSPSQGSEAEHADMLAEALRIMLLRFGSDNNSESYQASEALKLHAERRNP